MLRSAHVPQRRKPKASPSLDEDFGPTPVKSSFVYPALGGVADLGYFRIGGAGLANLLLIWARSLVAAERLGVRMLTPAWPALKIGPILRRESDLRIYAGLFAREPNAIGGLAKLLAFACTRRVERFDHPADLAQCRPNTLYVPRPHKIAPIYFDGLFDHQPRIAGRMLRMIRARHLDRVRALPRPRVAVHIRMGDFAPATEGPLRSVNTRLPLAWYGDRMAELRNVLGPDAHFTLFSDGSPDELAELLREGDVELRSGETAIVDLLSMARAQALLASASTYSLWASFLGRMPSLWYPGGMLQGFPAAHSLRLESAIGDRLPATFRDAFAACRDLLGDQPGARA
jgi:hypothetical protein